jgi:hypothetical protein
VSWVERSGAGATTSWGSSEVRQGVASVRARVLSPVVMNVAWQPTGSRGQPSGGRVSAVALTGPRAVAQTGSTEATARAQATAVGHRAPAAAWRADEGNPLPCARAHHGGRDGIHVRASVNELSTRVGKNRTISRRYRKTCILRNCLY